MLRLFDYWRSTAAYRVRIALYWKNIPFTSHSVHLVKDGGEQHSEDFRVVNPSALVPALQLPSGDIICQSLTIIQYLEDSHAQHPLIPHSSPEKYQALEIASMISCDLHPLNNLRVLQYLQGELGVEPDQKTQWYRHWLEKGFQAIEAKLNLWDRQGPFVLDRFSIADLFITAQVYNAKRFNISLDKYPRLAASYSASMALEAVKQAYPKEES